MQHTPKLWKKLLLGLAFSPLLLMGTSPFSGDSPYVENPEEWTLIGHQGDVKAFARLGSCGENLPVFFIRIENTSNDRNLNVEYSLNVSNDPSGGGIKIQIEVPASSSVEGFCESRSRELIAYAYGERASLSDLEFNLLTAKPFSHEE